MQQVNIIKEYTIKTNYNPKLQNYTTSVRHYECNFDIVATSFNQKTANEQHKKWCNECKNTNSKEFLNKVLKTKGVCFA